MTPADLVADLRARGIRLTVAGDRIRWTGPMASDDCATLAAHKPSILAYLTSQRPQEGPLPDPNVRTDLRSPRRSCFGPCPSCGETDWVARIPLTCRGCGYQEPLRFAGRQAAGG